MSSPRIEISYRKLAYNTKAIVNLYGSRGIDVVGVTKGVGAFPPLAAMLVKNGISTLADSRLSNIINMRDAGIEAEFLLLRIPMKSQAADVVKYADISLNSELTVMKALSDCAIKQRKIHQVILMLELGDLREGLMPEDLDFAIGKVIKMKGLELIGLGTNLACMGGITPNTAKMNQLSSIVQAAELKFKMKFKVVSGGNSANYQWMMQATCTGRINSLRIGESIWLGRETLERRPIAGLYNNAFSLVAEVIEVQAKASLPYGIVAQNAMGKKPVFVERGLMNRAILAIGIQDVPICGLQPRLNIEILAASSDHLIVDAKNSGIKVGQEIVFDINYSALLALMTSQYITKSMI